MAANYGKPKPVDPLWYRADRILEIHCGCGHMVDMRLADLLEERPWLRDAKLYEVIGRLKCRNCGGRPSAEVR